MRKLIYTSYSPNTRKKDIRANLRIYFQPWKWKSGPYPALIEDWFRENYGDEFEYFSYNYARSGMYQFFKSLNPKRGDQVIFQGFTCIAAVNPAVWAGFKPVYADIDPDTLAFSLKSLEKKITEKTKVIVLQHTLGQVGEIEAIMNLAKKRKVIVLEDCTQTILGKHNGKLLGTFGDAAVFSFGRDKVISGVDGGVLLLKNKDLLDNIDSQYIESDYPSYGWIWHELNFPIFWSKYKFLYRYSPKVAKLMHKIATSLGLVTRATTKEEKSGTLPASIPAPLPNALARLAYVQLRDLRELNKHRIEISKVYMRRLKGNQYLKLFKLDNDIAPVRFAVKAYKKAYLLRYMAERDVILGDWYSDPISPWEANPAAVNYKSGECPVGEEVGAQVINLPNHANISIDDANYIVDLIEEYYGTEKLN